MLNSVLNRLTYDFGIRTISKIADQIKRNMVANVITLTVDLPHISLVSKLLLLLELFDLLLLQLDQVFLASVLREHTLEGAF